MNDQQIQEIAATAFKAHFDIDVVRVNIRRGFDHENDPVVDLTIIYDGKYEQLNGRGLLDVDRDIMDKVWRDGEDCPGWPLVHYLPKSEIGRRDPAKVFSGPAPYGP